MFKICFIVEEIMRKNFYKIAEHKDEIITNLINNLIWVPIALLTPTVIKTIKSIWEKAIEKNFFTLSTIFDVISVVCALISLGVVIYDKIKKHSKDSGDTKKSQSLQGIVPIANFRIKSLEAEFFIKSEKEMISTLDYCLIANEDGIESFEKDIIWTGKKYHGTKLISSSNDKFELVTTSQNDSYCTYKVLFNEEIKCQREISFKLETTVSDEGKTMLPYYAYTVKHQIDKLTLRVVVNKDYIKRVKHSVYLDALRQMKVCDSKSLPSKKMGDYVFYEYTINNPTLLYRYFIEWEFTK